MHQNSIQRNAFQIIGYSYEIISDNFRPEVMFSYLTLTDSDHTHLEDILRRSFPPITIELDIIRDWELFAPPLIHG